MNLSATYHCTNSYCMPTRHPSAPSSTRNTTGPTATMRIGCRTFVDHLRTTSIYQIGAIKSMMKSLGLTAMTKWTVSIRTHLSRSCIIRSPTRCTIVPTELQMISSDAKRRKRFVHMYIQPMSANFTKSRWMQACLPSCRQMRAWNGMKKGCMSTYISGSLHLRQPLSLPLSTLRAILRR